MASVLSLDPIVSDAIAAEASELARRLRAEHQQRVGAPGREGALRGAAAAQEA
jgi:hypothetical protein